MALPHTLALDVRSATEFTGEGHVTDAFNVAHTRLWDRLDEVPIDRTVLVYCATGRRAARAVPLLEREGVEAIVVDDNLAEWNREAGLEPAGAIEPRS